MPLHRLSGVLLVIGIVYGCSGDDDYNAVLAKRCRPTLLRCDIERLPCVESLLEVTACERDDAMPPVPEVEHLTAGEVVERLEQQLAEDEMMEPSRWDPALRALALLPEGTSSTAVAIAQFVESVAAYYDPETKGITIITDSSAGIDELSRMYVLSHELTHYLQDREHDLQQLQDEARGTTDRAVALSSLVEGDAVVTSTRVLIRLMERSSNNFAWESYFGALQDQILQDIEASPAPLAEAVQDLPYSVGGLGVALRWNAAGRDAVDELFEAQPRAMCDWFGLALDPDESLVEPLACAPPRAPEGFSLYEMDSFGVAGAFALLTAVGESDLELASALRNDAIALYVTEETEEPATAPVIAVWRMRFSSSAQAQRYETSLRGSALELDLQRQGAELAIRVSSDPSESALRGPALAECPDAAELQPEREMPQMPRGLIGNAWWRGLVTSPSVATKKSSLAVMLRADPRR